MAGQALTQLPRPVVCPSLEGFKRCVDVTLGDIGGLGSAGGTGGLCDLGGLFQP